MGKKNNYKIGALEKRRAVLEEQYHATNRQWITTLNEADKILLKVRFDALGQEIDDIDKELDGLQSGEGGRGRHLTGQVPTPSSKISPIQPPHPRRRIFLYVLGVLVTIAFGLLLWTFGVFTRGRHKDTTGPNVSTLVHPVAIPTETNSLGMRLALIPAGKFLMGSPDSDNDASVLEKPQHWVRITRPFYLGVYEVTQQEYKTVMGQNPSLFSATGGGQHLVAGQDTRRYPVENVSWNDAIEFCKKLSEREGLRSYYGSSVLEQSGGDGYRLPTEAEWEYACRAGSTTRYSFGDDAASLGEFAWFAENSGGKTHPVGQKRPNDFGLYDLHGNVWEMCWDRFEERYYANSPPDDPLGPSQAADRVARGGCWSDAPRDLLVGGPEQGRTGRPEPLPGVSRRPSPVRSLSQGRLGAEPGAEAGGGDEEFLFSPRRRR